MKKPNSIKQLLGFIFLIMGLLFTILGYLSKIDILTTKINSKGDPAVIFPILGAALLISGILFFFIPLLDIGDTISIHVDRHRTHVYMTEI